ncbi:MAG TPA: hypothetical protein VFQ44_14605 [Streptosporangiaceae bacterium]|nr:hypothetical protein [Streptosporangiaceae bacterium]
MNFALTLGWAGPAESRIFDLPTAVTDFDLRQVSRTAGHVDTRWLAELSRQHLRRQDRNRTIAELAPFLRAAGLRQTRPDGDNSYYGRVLAIIEGRADSYADITSRFGYFWARPGQAAHSCLPADPLVLRAFGQLTAEIAATAGEKADHLAPWPGVVFELVRRLQSDLPAMSLGRALACAITGTDQAPALEATLRLLGPDETLARLRNALVLAGRRRV